MQFHLSFVNYLDECGLGKHEMMIFEAEDHAKSVKKVEHFAEIRFGVLEKIGISKEVAFLWKWHHDLAPGSFYEMSKIVNVEVDKNVLVSMYLTTLAQRQDAEKRSLSGEKTTEGTLFMLRLLYCWKNADFLEVNISEDTEWILNVAAEYDSWVLAEIPLHIPDLPKTDSEILKDQLQTLKDIPSI